MHLAPLSHATSLVGDAQFVLLGEASHGTHEFYAIRARITRRLIEEHGFAAVAVEADWPDAWRVNRWVRGRSNDAGANDALLGFRRFPTWMWRNTDVLHFVQWLRSYNDTQPLDRSVGFYGIDLYSLHASMEAVLTYLGNVDPPAARRARERYSCFEHFGEDPQRYGHAASFDLDQSCEEAVVRQLREMRERAAELIARDGALAADEFFFAEQNARLVLNAERYYRSMFRSRTGSWNLRDTHMADTLDALAGHLSRERGEAARIVVWAHNSHLGDARATEMGRGGELNVGQLVRERYGEKRSRLIGFTTHEGTVTAANDWDDPPVRMTVRPSLEGSVERFFHEQRREEFVVDLRGDADAIAELSKTRLERAIGVIYRPHSERLSHYFHADVADQFDAVIHVDRTHAVHPLDAAAPWKHDEVPETFPTGI